ncbi:hypothetical protein ACHAXT_003924 [Thalassiosira profunda]
MAAVAPAEPALVAPTDKDAAAAPADESAMDASQEDHDGEGEHPLSDEERDDDSAHEEEEVEVKEWDEGGKSHCGYGDQVHDTLMSLGQSIHKVVGEPSESVQEAMHTIGNWFQEASYAARDLRRGKMDVAGETAAAMKSVVTKEEDEEEDAEGEGEGEAAEGEEKEQLTPVKEDPKEADVSTDE